MKLPVGENGQVLLNVNIPKGKMIYVQFENLYLDSTRWVTVINRRTGVKIPLFKSRLVILLR